jgi:hypothetical protein
MTSTWSIRRLHTLDAAQIDGLVDVLLDCVEGGASEKTARDCGKTLLVLDAVTDGDAARLYASLGWTRVGDIPRYALMPRGGFCSTTVFYRDLGDS